MKDWEKAPMDETVCYCNNVTKADIINAITKGARTIKCSAAEAAVK